MPRVKSLVMSTGIDTAKRAHLCQANSRHRILAGNKRLKVRNKRSWDHYCVNCGKVILARDAAKLESLARQLTADLED